MSAKQLDQVAQATKTAFVFPGQGSQKVGMLAELAEQFASVEATFAEASKAVGFDLWHIAQSGEGLDQTEFTQPVLLTASIALWRRANSLYWTRLTRSSMEPARTARENNDRKGGQTMTKKFRFMTGLLAVVLALNVMIALLRRWRERVDGSAADLPVGVTA
jgi:hypothetical protein